MSRTPLLLRPLTLFGIVFLGFPIHPLGGECRSGQHPVTVADAIEMTRLGVPAYQDDDPPAEIAQFSPDGRRFAVVLKKGNLAHNANDYSLFIYDTSAALSSRHPETVLVFSSTSNREGIQRVKWLRDNRTILFIGEHAHAVPQIYSFDVVSRHLSRLTNHPTPVIAYASSDDGRVIVFEADPPARKIVDTPQTRRTGFVVGAQNLSEILLADGAHAEDAQFESRQLFRLIGGGKSKQILFEDGVWPQFALSVSPSGRYVLIEAIVRHIPESWMGYEDKLLHEFISAEKSPSALSLVERYLLLDTGSGAVTPLLDAPKSWEHDGFTWIDSGQSIVLSRAYLPLVGVGDAEKSIREKQTFVVEVKLPSRDIVMVTSDPLKVSQWDEGKRALLLHDYSGEDSNSSSVYRKLDNGWMKDVFTPAEWKIPHPFVTDEEGMNAPPQLGILDPQAGRRSLLLDLNPQFADLCFGKEQTVTWKATDGHEVEGGLYLPPGYVPGRRYPLVIQTHAFNPKRFWIDGPWSSAFAAQPLAGIDIIVLQVGGALHGGDRSYRSTPLEASRQMAAFEGAIDHLDQSGLIDRNKVGIIGFSRTLYHVAYTLTHSKYHFSAAVLADGIDGGYFQTIAFPTMAFDAYAINGGPPFGDTLPRWLDHSPDFNLADLHTPIRLEGHSVAAAIEEWEWYSVSIQMKKPVDFMLLPEGTHILVKPWERMASQQGTVDWFAFWLKGEEYPNIEKQPEYKRWNHLRELQKTEAPSNLR